MGLLGVRFSRILAASACLLSVLIPLTTVSDHDYPRLANYYTGDPATAPLEALARWDVLVLSVTCDDSRPTLLDSLKILNPEIVLLAYIPALMIWTSAKEGAPEGSASLEYFRACEMGNWWMYDTSGDTMSYWPGTYMVNATTSCPEDSLGRTFSDWYPGFVRDYVQATGRWDGVFLDCLFDEIAWMNDDRSFFSDPNAVLDSNMDGVPDNEDSLDASWLRCATELCHGLREAVGDEFILTSNGNNTQYEWINGSMREAFPDMHGGWDENMFAWYGYFPMQENYSSVPRQMILINSDFNCDECGPLQPPTSRSFYGHLRFTLSSTLLGDGYYTMDEEGTDHTSVWWVDIYEQLLGLPRGEAREDSFLIPVCPLDGDDPDPGEGEGGEGRYTDYWLRPFDLGMVVCNPRAARISYNGKRLGARDGLILPSATVGTSTQEKFYWSPFHVDADSSETDHAFDITIANHTASLLACTLRMERVTHVGAVAGPFGTFPLVLTPEEEIHIQPTLHVPGSLPQGTHNVRFQLQCADPTFSDVDSIAVMCSERGPLREAGDRDAGARWFIYGMSALGAESDTLFLDSLSDLNPPAIDSVWVQEAGATHAYIGWACNEPNRGRVDWGLTAFYGMASEPDTVLAVDHLLLVEGLTEQTAYHYRVAVWDSLGNSSTSEDRILQTITFVDTVPPLPPVAPRVQLAEACVFLSWEPSPEPDLSGYFVRRAEAQGGPYMLVTPQAISSPSYTDCSVRPDTEYSYVITSVDLAGNESGYSAEITCQPRAVFVDRVVTIRPNPSATSAWIELHLAKGPKPVTVRVYDVSGRLVVVLLQREMLRPGRHMLKWNTRSREGGLVASGVYYIKLDAPGEHLTIPLTILR